MAQGQEDAKLFLAHFEDEIVEALANHGKASRDLYNDYPNGDAFIHENYTDRDYSLSEAAAVLDQLSEWTETDSGLWEGLEPRRAIAAQAAYTYLAFVHEEIVGLLRDLNSACADPCDGYPKGCDPRSLVRAAAGLKPTPAPTPPVTGAPFELPED